MTRGDVGHFPGRVEWSRSKQFPGIVRDPGDNAENVYMDRTGSWYEGLNAMILRLSEKLRSKIHVGTLQTMPLDQNPFTDWSCHLFTVERTQYILLSNTPSLYSCVILGGGITNERRFLECAFASIREYMEVDQLTSIYEQFISPSVGTVNFAKALNRRIIGSMNELVMEASYSIQSDDRTLNEVSSRLNDTLLSAIATKEDGG